MKTPSTSPIFVALLLALLLVLAGAAPAQQIYQPNMFVGNQPPANNYMANSTAFRQEIARMEINVVREGRAPLPITQVPRLEKNDVLKLRLLDEQVNGMKPDQTNWDWTFLVAYINPARNNEKDRLVSEEIQFRKTGWYKEYSFVVPYDSQPIFFLYTKPKYRDKILSLINKNQEEIRKIGEKTIELSGAYAKIGSFLNELQFVINRYQYYNPYGGSYGYGGYNPYGSYNPYGTYTGTTGLTPGGFNQGMFIEQAIERLARSFNIQLPGCWQGNMYGYGGGNYGYYNGNNGGVYNPYGTYNNGVNNYPYYGGAGTYPYYGGNNYGLSNDFLGRAQCVAKSVRLEDFDLSVSRMLQQGGILAAAQLSQKYPQLAFWINVAAAALDFILKLTRKAPLKIVPTVISTAENPAATYGFQQNGVAPQSYNYQANNFAPGTVPGSAASPPAAAVKISLFAEAPPSENNFVTAYPLVVHKWQANPDPEVIGLPTPALMEQCLHPGQNVLRSTDLLNDWMSDTFTKDFKLVISSANGFRKEFPLKKNVGLGGWELNITREELGSFPKIKMSLESVITGKRGFNEIRSPQFELPIPSGGAWEVAPESQREFAAGERRTVTLRNQFGNCRCLQSVVYKPSFGGQFIYEAGGRENGLVFSENGTEVSFTVDARNFLPGAGQLELRQAGGEVTVLNLNLYPAPPNVTGVKVARGDNQVIISGERLEQIRAVKINGKRAVPADDSLNQSPAAAGGEAGVQQPEAPSYQGYAKNAQTPSSPNNYAANNQLTYSGGGNNPVNNGPPQQPAVSPNNNLVLNFQAPPGTGGYPPGAAPSPGGNGGVAAATPGNGSPGYQNNYPGGNVSVNNQINNQPSATYPPAFSSAAVPSYAAPPAGASTVGERIFVFADAGARQDSNTLTLELELENNRALPIYRVFTVTAARPTIVANGVREVEGVALTGNAGARTNTQIDLGGTSVFPITTRQISASVQNALTDYDFKAENIQIETRIEDGQVGAGDLPKADFEVLDWKNMQVTFLIGEQSQRLLGGRRLQFRIRDRVRGDSDWYTLRATFVRLPEIKSVKCTAAMKGNCELKGAGIEYISQVSVDGGKTWFPQDPATLPVMSTPDGQKAAQVPHFSHTRLLRIRLRDFRTNEGFAVGNFGVVNTAAR